MRLNEPVTLQAPEIISTMRELPLFESMADEKLSRIINHAMLKRVHRGCDAFQEGALLESYYVLLRGSVMGYQICQSGDIVAVALFHAVETLGESTLFNDHRAAISAKAITDLDLLAIDRAYFEGLAKDDSEILMGIIRNKHRRSRMLQRRLRDLLSSRSHQRVTNILISLFDHVGDEICITHHQLGELTANTRETVSFQLEQLQSLGIISLQRGRILVKEPSMLKRMANDMP
jgi:CRP-like cAMP-binding protein